MNDTLDNAVPFDVTTLDVPLDPLLDGLMRWVRCESPTLDADAVNRMMDMASADLVGAGAIIERFPCHVPDDYPGRVPDGLARKTPPDTTRKIGDAILARFPHPRANEPGVLIMGHLDTVHPVGTLEALPCRREGNRCFGPGINDMKAGDFLSFWAVKRLREAGIVTPLPVSILFTGDEEIGSPGTRALIEKLASQCKYVLVPEPARPDGSVVVGRHEILRFTLISRGKPTHAGNTPERGRSAIRQMAEKIIAIENLSDADATLTVGIVHGGLWSNCVATTCTAEMIMLVRDPACRAARLATLMALAEGEPATPHTPDNGNSRNAIETGFEIVPLSQRPRWADNEGTQALYNVANQAATALGMALPAILSGGGSDGNFTGALGIPTLDGLGACGQEHHTLNEHIFVDSLVPRTRLMAALLTRLD